MKETQKGDQNTIINARDIGQVIINKLSQKRVWIPMVLLLVTMVFLLWKLDTWKFSTSPVVDEPIEVQSIPDRLLVELPSDTLAIVELSLPGLVAGQRLNLDFEGKVQMGSTSGIVQPDGYVSDYPVPDEVSVWDLLALEADIASRPSRSNAIPHGAVMYRWQGEQTWNMVGSHLKISAPSSGDLVLELAINDLSVDNNQGSFLGTITME